MGDPPRPDVVKQSITPPQPALIVESDSYPADPPDSAFGRWFLANPTAQDGNDVTTFLYAGDLWRAMREEIDKTLAPPHFIYIIGRNLAMDTDMEISAAGPCN